jgi:hypothetical protein
LSSHFIDNHYNETATILSFALLDLPLTHDTSASHGFNVQDRSLEITAQTNVILFKKEVREAPIELNSDILVTHRYDVSG